MSNSYIDLSAIRAKLGANPRRLGFFKASPLSFPKPDWLKGVSIQDDPIGTLFDQFNSLWKKGVVVWGLVLKANASLYQSADDDCPGNILFSPVEEDAAAFRDLRVHGDRLCRMREDALPNPGWSKRELEWWEDMVNDMSYQRGFRLPTEWEPTGDAYRGSTVLFHRAHLPNRRIVSRMMPFLVDPEKGFAQLVPASFWPDGLVDWLESVQSECDPPEPEMRDIREAAYTEFFGPIQSVFHEYLPGPGHLDVYTFHWPVPREEFGYVSGGMSDRDQPGAGDFSRIELVFYAKAKSSNHARLVWSFAKYPWDTGAAIHPFDSIPLGDHGEAALGSARFEALLFLPGVAKPESPIHGSPLVVDHSVRLLTIVPITGPELDFKLTAGVEALMEKFREARFDLAFDPDRASLV